MRITKQQVICLAECVCAATEKGNKGFIGAFKAYKYMHVKAFSVTPTICLSLEQWNSGALPIRAYLRIPYIVN